MLKKISRGPREEGEVAVRNLLLAMWAINALQGQNFRRSHGPSISADRPEPGLTSTDLHVTQHTMRLQAHSSLDIHSSDKFPENGTLRVNPRNDALTGIFRPKVRC